MSYCRWSSDDWQSDVYVYADVSGDWTIHVAGRRHAFKVPLPEPVKWEPGDEPGMLAWFERARQVMDMLDDPEKCELVDIDLPHAGNTFSCPSPGEAADVLTMLANVGYHVPDGVIGALQEEQAELDELVPEEGV